MPWRVEVDENLAVIRCLYAGRVQLDDIKAATFKAIALAKKHKTRLVLIDAAELESAISTMEIYGLPEFYDTADTDRQSKWAFLLPPAGQIREDAKFYVTVCRNRGWNIQAYDDRQGAIDWLLNESEST